MTTAGLAARFGTPLYVYDVADVRAAHARLSAALPAPSRLYYSVKANPHPDVASVLAVLGCHAEVSSAGEIEAALAAGFPPDRIMMTGPAKVEAALDFALDCGVCRFSAESPADLARIGAAAARARMSVRCLLRVNADSAVAGMGLSMTGTASPFGADASWLVDRPDDFRADGVESAGLHLYMGTNIADPDRLVEQFATSIELASQLGQLFPLSEVDLGGGFATAYAHRGGRVEYPALADRLGALLDAHLPDWRAGTPLIAFESGRYLVGGSGTLVASVMDVKQSKGRTFVVLDTGVHHLGGMSGLRRLPRIVPDVVPDGGAVGRDIMPDCVVAGPLCTPLDVWSDGVPMPEVRPGELVTVPNVGAYGVTASLVAFLGHPMPAEVVVDGDRIVSATRLTLARADAGARHIDA